MTGREQATRLQFGALPYRFRQDGSLEILLVTSRRTRRWIIPKGWAIKHKTPAKSAAREAYEEAGVQGVVRTISIGSFVYDKWLDDDDLSVRCEVHVFPLQVERQRRTWPEHGERETRWLDPDAALLLVEEPGLRSLISDFHGGIAARGG
ncbi:MULTISPECIES: NUDIX hydrolase [Inquilinus]|uniref:8-oxo-dGTP pyrophosphatase MutT (NUDIX family) n=1 Tax=Inquilinus ginsengisoli TaxID=363840 RepID=A0ABU1JQ17_9PROT|nr:NUDIX hydrolase [Inquilinus ginsengisoli]MDR6290706.1 8-oxo-dGTP pyrophosphatase MutT (NUDIX family) [Inquilinus ginsengisoli]